MKIINKFSSIVILPIVLIFIFQVQVTSSNIQTTFQVKGTKIYDLNNREFIARGVNVNGPGYGWWGNTPAVVDDIVERWKFNAIRLGIRELEPVEWIEENGTLEQIINLYTARKVVVVLTAFEKTGYYFTDEKLTKLKQWWQQQARKYKDNPFVWFNVSNEPGGFDSAKPENVSKWISQNQTIINAIRNETANNIIVVDAHYWGQDVGEWNNSPVKQNNSSILSHFRKLKDPKYNLIASVHLYDQWEYGEAKMRNFFDRIRAARIPFIIGEYGAKNDETFQNTVTWALKLAKEKRIGSFAWAWAGQDDFDLTTSNNGGGQHSQYDNIGNATNLSWYGKQVWANNRVEEKLVVD